MEDDNENMVAQSLVGRKVKLKINEIVRGEGENKRIYHQYKIDDPEFVAEVNAISSNNRILPPGTGGTMDFQMFRLNVHINEDGIVTDVAYN